MKNTKRKSTIFVALMVILVLAISVLSVSFYQSNQKHMEMYNEQVKVIQQVESKNNQLTEESKTLSEEKKDKEIELENLSKDYLNLQDNSKILKGKIDKLGKEKDNLQLEIEKLKKKNEELAIAKAKKEEQKRLKLAEEKESKTVNTNGLKGKVASASSTTKKKPVVSRGGEPKGKTYVMEATYYAHNCSGCSGITATGFNLRANPNAKIAAVDPRVIPLGSKLWIEGYGYAIAADTGGAIKNMKIDLNVHSEAYASTLGRHKAKVVVLGK